MRKAIVGLGILLAASCGGSSSPCDGVKGTCVAIEAGAKESDVSSAFSTAKPGSTIAFAGGTFNFTNTLALSAAASGVTITGQGQTSTILDFTNQAAGSDGIDVQQGSDNFTISNLTVQNTIGDGIRVQAVNGVTFRNVTVTWTRGPNKANGSYGLYPVSSSKVTIDSCTVSGASDAGIYVGQSDKIIVKNSTATQNVAGIEIENSTNADVSGNTAKNNTGGILVFDLPGLAVQGGHNVHVFNNTIQDNNTANFASSSSTVSIVPAGTGAFVMANHDVEVDGNTISGNKTAAFSVISYLITSLPFDDPNYYPFPANVYVHGNTFTNNGTNADTTQSLGLLLAGAFGSLIPSTIYDGIVDPSVTTGGPDPMAICISSNTGSSYANLHFDQFNGTNLSQIITTDSASVNCTLPPLPAVTF
jgi:parallel beta-helix repeat protein